MEMAKVMHVLEYGIHTFIFHGESMSIIIIIIIIITCHQPHASCFPTDRDAGTTIARANYQLFQGTYNTRYSSHRNALVIVPPSMC